ncbi:MAG: cell division protein FtsA [Bacillota bacterium]|nr:cell division protein FtsA [Bacillota bacterium]
MPRLARGNTIVGLDVGSTKVAVLVGEVGLDEQLQILGFGTVPSAGIRRGAVVDIENTVRSIEEAVEKAEQMSGRPVDGGYVGASGTMISSLNNRGVVAVSNPDQEITQEDVERVLQAARVIALPHDRRIIHVIPRQFIVDGNDNILDPVGMLGARLEVETHIVTSTHAAIQNLLKCCERAGFHVQELVLNAYASGEAVLFPAEKELGVAVVDIGGGTTDIAIFDQGSLWFTCVLPVGGDYITSDLAVGLRTPLNQAEIVKKDHGCTLPALTSDSEYVEISSVGGKETCRVSKRMIANIIQPRVQEILYLVKNQLDKSGYQGLLPGGIVLTGGTALTEGIVELATEELQRPVRIGYPEAVGGLADVVRSPTFATGIGLLLYGAKKRNNYREEFEGLSWRGIVSKVKKFFKDLF